MRLLKEPVSISEADLETASHEPEALDGESEIAKQSTKQPFSSRDLAVLISRSQRALHSAVGPGNKSSASRMLVTAYSGSPRGQEVSGRHPGHP